MNKAGWGFGADALKHASGAPTRLLFPNRVLRSSHRVLEIMGRVKALLLFWRQRRTILLLLPLGGDDTNDNKRYWSCDGLLSCVN